MYNLLIVAAILLLIPVRLGFGDAGQPLIDFAGTKTGFFGIDIDLAPDLVGAVLLLIAAIALLKKQN